MERPSKGLKSLDDVARAFCGNGRDTGPQAGKSSPFFLHSAEVAHEKPDLAGFHDASGPPVQRANTRTANAPTYAAVTPAATLPSAYARLCA